MPRARAWVHALAVVRRGRPKSPEEAIALAAHARRGEGPTGYAPADLGLLTVRAMRRARRSIQWAAAYAAISEAEEQAWKRHRGDEATGDVDAVIDFVRRLREDVLASVDPSWITEVETLERIYAAQLRQDRQ